MTKFQETILKIVRQIPAGKVASYGQVAAYAGMPRGARMVGWTMAGMGDFTDFPWWRVVNNAGAITIKGIMLNAKEVQKKMLVQEGVEVDKNLKLDIEKYRYRPSMNELEKLGLDKEYMADIFEKYNQN